MELGHSVFAVKEVSDFVAIFEGLYVLPQRTDARDLDIDLGMPTDAIHDFFGVSLLEVDGLAITLDDRVPRRFQDGRESENILVEEEALFHVGHRQHGADSLCYG